MEAMTGGRYMNAGIFKYSCNSGETLVAPAGRKEAGEPHRTRRRTERSRTGQEIKPTN